MLNCASAMILDGPQNACSRPLSNERREKGSKLFCFSAIAFAKEPCLDLVLLLLCLLSPALFGMRPNGLRNPLGLILAQAASTFNHVNW